MSATGRGGERIADDFYVTPQKTTALILPRLRTVASILDPCAGDGAILRMIQQHTPHTQLAAMELDAQRARACAAALGVHCIQRDAIFDETPWPDVNTVVMNSPFSLACAFVDRACNELHGDFEVAALMRLSMLGSRERKAFWQAHPADIFVLTERPNFTEPLRYCKAKGERPCGQFVVHTRTGKCKRPSGHEGPCMSCGTDSTEYAWFLFGPGHGHRWERLEAS